MKRTAKSVAIMALMGMSLVAYNLGGVSGCGGGEEGGGSGTAEQQQQALSTFKSAGDVGVQVQIQLLALAGLIVEGINKDQAETNCAASGSYTTTVTETTLTLDFNNCDFGCEVVDGAVPFTLADGTSSFNLSVTSDFSDSFTLSGTSDATADLTQVLFNLVGTSASAEVQVSGTLNVNDDGTFSGTLVMTGEGTNLATCNLDHFSLLVGTIGDLAAACGIDVPTCS